MKSERSEIFKKARLRKWGVISKEEACAKSEFKPITIHFDSIDDARNVRELLKEIIELYGVVTVGDYYEACGVRSEFLDEKYGWRKLNYVIVKWDDDFGGGGFSNFQPLNCSNSS